MVTKDNWNIHKWKIHRPGNNETHCQTLAIIFISCLTLSKSFILNEHFSSSEIQELQCPPGLLWSVELIQAKHPARRPVPCTAAINTRPMGSGKECELENRRPRLAGGRLWHSFSVSLKFSELQYLHEVNEYIYKNISQQGCWKNRQSMHYKNVCPSVNKKGPWNIGVKGVGEINAFTFSRNKCSLPPGGRVALDPGSISRSWALDGVGALTMLGISTNPG